VSVAAPLRFQPVAIDREATRGLLPQRPPLLLVDVIRGLGAGPRPALQASFAVALDQPVLAGHFPGRPLWPGSYTIEGLAQSCALLGGLLAARAAGAAPWPLPPGWVIDPGLVVPAAGSAALLCAVDVKLLVPIAPPAELFYEVALTHVVGAILRFEVEALCARRAVARGALSVTLGDAR
jgi:3-hydroxyacyl-[acyl-carrier-protein] dehydratase